jgi:hypothetical protein
MIRRLLVIMLLGWSPVLGQNFDTVVSGQVQTPNGVLMGAIPVTLSTLSPSSRISIRTQTNDDGFFRFSNVRPGQYTVFAGAIVATLLPGAIEGARAIVFTTPGVGGGLRSGIGTYFPGTADLSTATAINVAAGTIVDNINFTLTTGALNWDGPPFRMVPVKIVVEGGGTPTFQSDQFSLTFSDGPANVSANVTFLGGPRKPAGPLTRIERQREPFLVTSVIPMPTFPDGEFRLALPEGILRVGPAAPISPSAGGTSSHVVVPARSYFYIKSMTFGATDLMKELMTLRTPDTLVITLARCTDTTTQEPLCR